MSKCTKVDAQSIQTCGLGRVGLLPQIKSRCSCTQDGKTATKSLLDCASWILPLSPPCIHLNGQTFYLFYTECTLSGSFVNESILEIRNTRIKFYRLMRQRLLLNQHILPPSEQRFLLPHWHCAPSGFYLSYLYHLLYVPVNCLCCLWTLVLLSTPQFLIPKSLGAFVWRFPSLVLFLPS